MTFGLVALILPGPGLLGLAGGLLLLATRYAWAKRSLRPVKRTALKLAIMNVQSWYRIIPSVFGGFVLIAVGIVWGVGPAVPHLWPLDDRWWLIGGWATASTLIVSGCLVIGLLTYSFRRFRRPTSKDLKTADEDQPDDPGASS